MSTERKLGRPPNAPPLTAGSRVVASEVIYMLNDRGGGFHGGPYAGAPYLDLQALAAHFRAQRYAAAEAAGEDYAWCSEEDFVESLVNRGLIRRIETLSVDISIETHGENRYVPKHWPLCPSCGVGRGEECMGTVLRSLNRAEWHRQCTSCGNTWEHEDRPYRSNEPMLDDDGRYIDSACVPYALSQAGGLPMNRALEICRPLGFREGEGMPTDAGIAAAEQLGVRLVPWTEPRIAGVRTLSKVLARLSPAGNYILATRNHWLAVVAGENRDNADTHLRSEVVNCWEVRRPAAQAPR